jgi:DNA-binding response OmpR family regulator
MPKILIVDDDADLCVTLKGMLTGKSYLVELAADGEGALKLMGDGDFDVIVLDWSLPDISGEEICRRYRNNDGQTPIIFLTGKNDVEFLERGLSAGADDYLIKPFNGRELFARLESLLRRKRHKFRAHLGVGSLVLKPESNTIVLGDRNVSLRPKETALLEYFLRNPDQIFNAQQLLEALWPSDSSSTVNSVRTWVGFLRHKLEPIGYGQLIRTIPSVGYILDSHPW